MYTTLQSREQTTAARARRRQARARRQARRAAHRRRLRGAGRAVPAQRLRRQRAVAGGVSGGRQLRALPRGRRPRHRRCACCGAWPKEYPASPLIKRADPALKRLVAAAPATSAANAGRRVGGRRAPAPPPAPAPAAPPLSSSSSAAGDAGADSRPAPTPRTPGVARIQAIRRTVLPDVVRIAIELDQEIDYRYERIEGPVRVFLDLRDTDVAPTVPRRRRLTTRSSRACGSDRGPDGPRASCSTWKARAATPSSPSTTRIASSSTSTGAPGRRRSSRPCTRRRRRRRAQGLGRR